MLILHNAETLFVEKIHSFLFNSDRGILQIISYGDTYQFAINKDKIDVINFLIDCINKEKVSSEHLVVDICKLERIK